ncbi:hypothetical protein SKAU_G00076360 [Synaphobranchus kaupii]|uniref:Uncharacterized protein n=1 Tax=Synaphobranchus kaupii TaxID=118154 RepID=A0A9Q1JB14_SYNKA|nr:hypothetical protein SKAU_G00076360 [Synaphobranchus kaupii]
MANSTKRCSAQSCSKLMLCRYARKAGAKHECTGWHVYERVCNRAHSALRLNACAPFFIWCMGFYFHHRCVHQNCCICRHWSTRPNSPKTNSQQKAKSPTIKGNVDIVLSRQPATRPSLHGTSLCLLAN